MTHTGMSQQPHTLFTIGMKRRLGQGFI